MKIEWTKPAELDLENIRDYIKKDSEYYAERTVEKIIIAVEKLGKFPEMGRSVPEAEEKNIREILFFEYRIMYIFETKRILILAIIHGSRDVSQKKPKPWEII